MVKQLLLLEFRSFVRNKRLIVPALSTFALLMLCLYSIFDETDEKDVDIIVLFVFFIMSNGPVGSIGFFMFNKDGCFFDGLRTRPLTLKDYVTAKIIFLMLFSGLYIVVTVPFIFYMQPFMQLLTLGCLVYMTGVGSALMIYCSSFDKRKINYRRSPLFNYEGTLSFGKALIMLLPMLPLLIFYKYKYFYILLMFSIGSLGLLFVKLWIHIISKNLARRKYLMLQGFRQ